MNSENEVENAVGSGSSENVDVGGKAVSGDKDDERRENVRW